MSERSKASSYRKRRAARRAGEVAERRSPPDGQKWCPDCQTFKPFDEFPRNKRIRVGATRPIASPAITRARARASRSLHGTPASTTCGAGTGSGQPTSIGCLPSRAASARCAARRARARRPRPQDRQGSRVAVLQLQPGTGKCPRQHRLVIYGLGTYLRTSRRHASRWSTTSRQSRSPSRRCTDGQPGRAALWVNPFARHGRSVVTGWRGGSLRRDDAAARVLPARLVVVQRLPVQPRARPAAGQARPADGMAPAPVEAPHGTTIVADHPHDRRDPGRRPARDDGQRHRAARHGEGLPGRRVLRGRHRRHGGRRDRAGPALPGRARALREARGHDAQPRRQGQPALAADPQQPADGDAGPRGRTALRRLRPRGRPTPRRPVGSSPTTSPAAATRSAASTRSAPAASTPAAP